MARKEYTTAQLDEIRGRGKDVVYNIDEDYPLEGVFADPLDFTEQDRGSFIFADIPRGEGQEAFEIIEVGDPYNDAFGDLRRDVLLASVLNPQHLTNWQPGLGLQVRHYPNSRVLRLA